jgi:hypothetical protein
MKNYYGYVAIMTVCLLNVYLGGQEVITVPKNKKKYVSEQQCLELKGDIVMVGTDMAGTIADLSKIVFMIIKDCLNAINDHVDGIKCAFTKSERTAQYEKMMKIKDKIDQCNDEIRAKYQELALLYEECKKICEDTV